MLDILIIVTAIYIFFLLVGAKLLHNHTYKYFWIILSILMISFIFLLVISVNDKWLIIFPLYIQKNVTLVSWYVLAGILALISLYFYQFGKKWYIVLIHLGFLPLFYYVNQPIYAYVNTNDDMFKSKVTEETTLYSCACAALSTLTKQIGLHIIDEKEACRILGTTRIGSTTGQMRYALTTLDIPYDALFDTSLDKIRTPAILYVDRRGGRENHAIVYLRKEGGYYLVYDPMEGRRKLSKRDLYAIWHGHGIEVLLR